MYPENVLFCRLDGSNPTGKEQKRLLSLEDSGLLQIPSPKILNELLELVLPLLGFPVGWVGLMERDYLKLKATIGLSQWGLTHNLITQRSLPRLSTFCTYVVDSQQPLSIDNTIANPAFVESELTQCYGIRSYLGAPLMYIDDRGDCFCVGTIAVMDHQPRTIQPRDRQWIQILARWCMSEYILALHQTQPQVRREPPSETIADQFLNEHSPVSFPEAPVLPFPDAHIRLQTIYDLAQSCHNPVTAVMGMARMLEREIYGPLTPKQREYVEIINRSSQTLLMQAQEIQSLSTLPQEVERDHLFPLNLELIGRQVLNQLKPIAKENHLDLDFSAESSPTPWYGEQAEIKQILIHLLQGVIAITQEHGTLHLHLSYPPDQAKFTLWFLTLWVDNPVHSADEVQETVPPQSPTPKSPNSISSNSLEDPPLSLRLQFCQQLVQHLGGELLVVSSPDMGKRYTITLPRVEPDYGTPLA